MAITAAVGGAAVGAYAGSQDDVSHQSTNISPATGQERALQESSFQNYLQQQALADKHEQAIADSQPLQDQSRGSVTGILNGNAFNINQNQQNEINNVRDANIAAGRGNIDNFIKDQLQGVTASAADRGVRGQALSQLQTGAINEGTRQYGNLVSQANATAAQQSMDNPYRQAALQGGLASQNVSLADNMREQAIQNRQQLQNPALMSYLQNERIAGAGHTTVGESNGGKMAAGAISGATGAATAANGLKKSDGGFVGGNNGGSGGSNYSTSKPVQFFKDGGVVGQRDDSGYIVTRKKENDQLPEHVSGEKDMSKGFKGPEPTDWENIKKHLGFYHGGLIPGHEVVPGDHPANDTVPIQASPGEIIVPKSHAHDPKLAKAFIDYLFRSHHAKKGS